MSHIYRELNEIPIPSFAHVNRGNGRVFVSTRNGDKRGQMVIGLATSETTMHPNGNFKFHYPELWRKAYGDDELQPHEIHAGLYGLFLGASHANGLYDVLNNCWGTLYTNAALDYAMFCSRDRSDATYLMPEFSARQLLFSDKTYDNTWYGGFFSKILTPEKVNRFRIDWLKHCADKGCKGVWLCIDGSNNDCTVKNSDLAEPGNSKSHNAVNIYSYIWAVNAKDGTPVTWFVGNGGKIDSKAFEKIERFLEASGIRIEGVILDRGFANKEVLKLIRACGHQYIVMLKSSAFAYKAMFNKYAAAIRWRVPFLLDRAGLFGVTEENMVFGSKDLKATIGFYFNGQVSTQKSVDVIEQVFDACDELKKQIAAKIPFEKISIPTQVSDYIALVDNSGKPEIRFTDKLQQAIDAKGYSAIASSDPMSAGEISAHYDDRGESEKGFSGFKSQVGLDVTRVHCDASIQAKLAVGFITSIVRTDIALACKRQKLATNKMLREVDRCVLALMPNGRYSAIHDLSDRMKRLFSEFGLTNDFLEWFASEVNHRKDPIHSQKREMPPFKAQAKKKPGRPPKQKTAEQANKPKRKPGRPKGSKNKKTLEREALMASMPPKEKRKPGRPKGSKNKKTLAREAMASAPKRGRGRPRGSKNKKTLAREQNQKKKTNSS